MNVDELGEKGESRFREICADVGLIANKSDRDRAGWDFIIDFPFGDRAPEGSFDRRKAPLSCHVQVKTVLTSTDRVRLRLSSAERLAKEAKPSFICVLRVDGELKFESMWLIHILNDPLGVILKRLRVESAKKTQKINDLYLSLPIRRFGVRCPVSGTALRDGIVNAVGGDLASYLARKQQQLKTLGYKGSGRGFEIAMKAPSLDHAANTFLGLEQSVDFLVKADWEERFGIKISRPRSESAYKAEIRPTVADGCTVQFRETALASPVNFRGELFLPAIPLPFEHWKFLVKTQEFSLQMGPREIRFTSSPFAVVPEGPTAWSHYWRLMRIILRGGSLKLIPDKIHTPMVFDLPAQKFDLTEAECDEQIRTCDELANILQIAGEVEEPKLSFGDLLDAWDYIAYLGPLARGEDVDPPRLPAENWARSDSGTNEAIWVECFALGTGAIAFAATIGVKKVPDGLQIERPKIRAIRYLLKPLDEFVDFEKEMAGNGSVSNLVGGRPMNKDGKLSRQPL